MVAVVVVYDENQSNFVRQPPNNLLVTLMFFLFSLHNSHLFRLQFFTYIRCVTITNFVHHFSFSLHFLLFTCINVFEYMCAKRTRTCFCAAIFQSERRERACAWRETLHTEEKKYKIKSNICISIEPVLSSLEKEMNLRFVVFGCTCSNTV